MHRILSSRSSAATIWISEVPGVREASVNSAARQVWQQQAFCTIHRFSPSGPGVILTGSLFHIAGEYGMRDPRRESS